MEAPDKTKLSSEVARQDRGRDPILTKVAGIQDRLATGDERTALRGAFPDQSGIVLISGIVLALRMWWVRRRMARHEQKHGDLEAEYSVIREDDRQD